MGDLTELGLSVELDAIAVPDDAIPVGVLDGKALSLSVDAALLC
jgi:hypothetical protein